MVFKIKLASLFIFIEFLMTNLLKKINIVYLISFILIIDVFNKPLIINAQFMPPPPPPLIEATLKEGDLVRAKNDFKVYKIIKNQKHWIKNQAVFNSYKLDWRKIKIVEPEVLNSFPSSYLIKLKGDNRVYYISANGLKKHIINENVFYSYNNRWEDIIEVNNTEFNSYEDVKLIKLKGDFKIFLLENKTKRHITSPAVFKRLGFNWNKILEINMVEFNEYRDGVPVY